MRWPFGPPHLTLEPSQNNNKNTKTPQKNTKHELFSYQSNFSFFGGCPKFPFLTTWPWGFSKVFWKTDVHHETAIFGKKKNKPEIPVIIFCLFLFQQQKTQKMLKPLFSYCFSKPKKENFQMLNLKHRNLKNPIFAPFFWKRLFLESWQIIGHKKNTKW